MGGRYLENTTFPLDRETSSYLNDRLSLYSANSEDEGYKRLKNALSDGKVSGFWLKRIKNLYENNDQFRELMDVRGINWVESRLKMVRDRNEAAKKNSVSQDTSPPKQRNTFRLGKITENTVRILVCESIFFQ